jgi:Zn-dependent M16 (insulinase) family peptidase
MEGPFWKQIRGPGLSYGYTIRPAVEEGLVVFGLSRSVNVWKAYNAAQNILNEYASGKVAFEDAYLDAARSSVLFAFISREETMSDAALQTFLGYVKGISNRQVRNLTFLSS